MGPKRQFVRQRRLRHRPVFDARSVQHVHHRDLPLHIEAGANRTSMGAQVWAEVAVLKATNKLAAAAADTNFMTDTLGEWRCQCRFLRRGVNASRDETLRLVAKCLFR